jgi:hypothetical protein
MSETSVAVGNAEKPAADAKPKRARKASKGKQRKKTAKARKTTDKPSVDRSNKKPECNTSSAFGFQPVLLSCV